MIKYRKDIDSLRAYAVIAVIFFHLGYLPYGYLGVDVFFVISGYLITGIIYKRLDEQTFSISHFYERRVRRILPLLFFITTFALTIGVFVMLPNDLENLSQSVVASNFSANNILMLITSSDYWSIGNDYKPLMHTWSLGVEEQYYILYPFLLLLISKIRLSGIKIFLIISTFISLILFIYSDSTANKFYLLHFRFFELSTGGLCAIIFFKKNVKQYIIKALFYLSITVVFLLLFTSVFGHNYSVILITLFTALMLITTSWIDKSDLNDLILKYILQNKIIVYVGKISFSLYLWHHLIFAFSRYIYFEKIDILESVFLIMLTFMASIVTYHFIENPFRARNLIKTKTVYIILGLVFLMSTSSALYLNLIGGVYKDFPAINMTKKDIEQQGYNFFSSTNNIHIRYNEKIRSLDKEFENNDDFKLLIIGHSYGRDVANIFLESSYFKNIDLKYFDINRTYQDKSIKNRWQKADLVILATNVAIGKDWILGIGEKFKFSADLNKLFVFGPKNFGLNNGIHYNKLSTIENPSKYHVKIQKNTLIRDKKLKRKWGDNYLSLIQPLLNENNEIRIFTDEGKFISQDTHHLTKAGAKFYAKILDSEIKKMLKN